MDRAWSVPDVISRATALVIIALGVVVIAGWQADAPELKTVVPGVASMNPLTALCFVVAAVSLLVADSNVIALRRASAALAVAVVMIAAWDLISGVGEFAIQPDQILYREAVNAFTPPSRMAESTGTGFLVVGLGLAVLQWPSSRGRVVAQYFGFAGAFIGIFGAIGYLYGAGTVQAIRHFSLMAPHTAWGTFLLSVGLLSRCTQASWMRLTVSTGAAGKILRVMLPAALVIIAALGWLCVQGERQGYFGAWMAPTLLSMLSVIVFVPLTLVIAGIVDRDEQELKWRLEQIRTSESRISGILSIAADAIISVDAAQRITVFNAWAEKIFGYSRDEIIGRPLEILLPERVRAVHRRNVEDFGVSSSQARRMGERDKIFALRKNGEQFPAEASISKLLVDGEMIYTVVLRDTTERQQTAEALVRAKEAAEVAAQSKSDFLANMSHEIRTPLNSIAGFTQLLLGRDDLPDEPRNQVRKIMNSTSVLISVVNDILDYSKLEEGKIDLALTAFCPFALANNCISIMESIADRNDLAIRVAAEPALQKRYFMGDANRIQQIVINLLSNAVKFTKEGSITVSIDTAPVPGSAANSVRIAVKDTGIGIPRESVDRLFQRFSQVDNSTSRTYGGTGLGLAICKRLVLLMKGEIGVESEPGKGSTFWFRVPLEPAEAPDSNAVADESKSMAGVTGLSILLAEDVELNQEIAVAMLEAEGHHVTLAADGLEAIECVKANDFDLVLMDIQMPRMDGIAAAKKIRAMKSGKGAVPIVAMTANVLPDEVERFYKAGMVGHIRKPIDRSELIAEVNRAARTTAEAA